MIVLDASVLANMLVYADERGRKARTALARDTQWAAPEHWMIEVFSVLRGLSLAGKITPGLAERSVDRLPRLGIDHVPVTTLLPYMWRCKDEISGYDSAYVALAATRRVTMVTADARLARAATRHCAVELAA
jgi:predicted nucleic acid-binding protein